MRLKQGITAPAAADTLSRVLIDLGNLRGHRHDAASAYLKWAGVAESQLRQLFVEPHLVQGLHTPRYTAIMDLMGVSEGNPALLPLYQEIEHQYAVLSEAKQQLDRLLELAQRPGDLIFVYDTNSLMHYQPPNRIQWFEFFEQPKLVRVIIPLCVVAELDEKGHSGSPTMAKRARAASRALREITEGVAPGHPAALLHPDTRVPLGASLEILLEERGHRRLPQADDEIIDQAVLLAGLADKPVFLLTHDLNMSVRARAADVKTIELPTGYKRDRESD